jgi:hypothetical protein
MANTPNFGIYYPTGTAQVTPIQAPFATMASSIEEALTDLQASIPNQSVASAAERDALFPNPQQGDAVYIRNKGWTERYYNIYNAATNPGGAITAGWQAIDLKPGPAAVTPFSGSSGWSIVQEHGRRYGALAFVSCTFKRTGSKIVVPANGNLNNTQVATISSAWQAISGPAFPMSPINTGRLVAGGLDNNSLFITAVGGGGDIATNEQFSLSGWYVLANP